MKLIDGDIFLSDVPVIMHQCNCFHTMGAGFALELSNRYKEVSLADKNTPFGSKLKLGTCSVAEIKDGGNLRLVVNVYSQFGYGRKCETDYEAFSDGIEDAFYFLQAHFEGPVRVGVPYLMGCGLAGGDENIILSIFEEKEKMFDGIEIEIYRLKR